MTKIHEIQNILDYIEEQLCDELSLEQIADQAYMSIPSLYRLFYTYTGHPIKEYVRKRRISVSAWKIRYSSRSMLDIAFDCGFNSYQAFTKIFKKIVGMSPKDYKASENYYIFEAMQLNKESNVKLVRLWPVEVAVYRFLSNQEEGIEQAAFESVVQKGTQLGWDIDTMKFYGLNVEIGSGDKKHFGYEIMIPLEQNNKLLFPSDFTRSTFSGGLYAVSHCPETSGEKVVSAWNTLMSEWLPKSTFELGDHTYFEEITPYQRTITCLKLHLPVKRNKISNRLEVTHVDPFAIYSCKQYGPDAQKNADEQLTEWLTQNNLNTTSPNMKLFMSYGTDEDFWYELSLSVPEQFGLTSSERVLGKELGGGLYVYFISGAYGLMRGVLEQIHNWIEASHTYTLDNSRQWFAEYIVRDGNDLERTTQVKYYIPIIES